MRNPESSKFIIWSTHLTYQHITSTKQFSLATSKATVIFNVFEIQRLRNDKGRCRSTVVNGIHLASTSGLYGCNFLSGCSVHLVLTQHTQKGKTHPQKLHHYPSQTAGQIVPPAAWLSLIALDLFKSQHLRTLDSQLWKDSTQQIKHPDERNEDRASYKEILQRVKGSSSEG